MTPVRTTLHNLVSVYPSLAAAPALAAAPLTAASSGVSPAGASPGGAPAAAPAVAPAAVPAVPTASMPSAAGAQSTGSGTSPQPTSQGVFVTRESLLAFPVASGVVIVIWKVLQKVFPAWGASLLIPLAVAFLVGLFVYWISITEQTPPKEKKIALIVAIINSFFLAASALGIQNIT